MTYATDYASAGLEKSDVLNCTSAFDLVELICNNDRSPDYSKECETAADASMAGPNWSTEFDICDDGTVHIGTTVMYALDDDGVSIEQYDMNDKQFDFIMAYVNAEVTNDYDPLYKLVIMADGCTAKSAADHLDRGTVVYNDLPGVMDYIIENETEYLDGEEREACIEAIKKMVYLGQPMPDWSVVRLCGKTFFVQYVL